MKKNISEAQIQQLFKFTLEENVRYYDVRIELVDHLANSIEDIWEKQPDIAFEAALELAVDEFGIDGFSNIVFFRKATLSKFYNKLLLNKLTNFFKLPKILLISSVVLLLFFTSGFFQNKVQFFSFILGSIALAPFVGYLLMFLFRKDVFLARRKRSIKQYKEGEIWLLEAIIQRANGIPSIVMGFLIQVVIWGNFIFKKYLIYSFSPLVCFMSSFILVIIGLSFYLMWYYLPQNAGKYLAETYPEYNLV